MTRRPSDSIIAAELLPTFLENFLWNPLESGYWYEWQDTESRWRYVPPDRIKLLIARFLDSHPAFTDGYSTAKLSSLERLIRIRLSLVMPVIGSKSLSNRDLWKYCREVAL